MGLSEFEKELRDKMEERSIVPSDTSWDRVVAGLEEPKKKVILLNWYWVAAILVIGVFISYSVFFKSSEIHTIEVVNTDVDAHDVLKEGVLKVNTKPEVEFKKYEQEDAVVVTRLEVANKVIEHSAEVEKVNKNAFEKEIQKVPNAKLVSIQEAPKTKSPEDIKVQEVVAELTGLHGQGVTITDDLVDSLLLKAQEELRAEKLKTIISKENNTDVLAKALLEEVEYDLHKSFKEKVFEALHDGFFKVETAVAERGR
ncbi:hypothetical protein NBRC110019_01820 [Neptunitalea chrysea]|uniref:Uncharacterized protein n=1 Tax=Neptunitalea chrysea TaxID=1647581 RepID=A0A9W6EV59_9FLAO|nr:hypothetical protein [Neptunitalea chrysea]GLB51143.1 hypothetical protein NBRC110019_01820 [Neptunitalea chrysea]